MTQTWTIPTKDANLFQTVEMGCGVWIGVTGFIALKM